MTEATVKDLVKRRDGNRCVRCGMTADRHCEIYGRGLQVHRKEPGSEYTVDGCETVCVPCHNTKPKRWNTTYRPRPRDAVRVRMELDPADMPAVEEAAHACRLSLASFCRLAVEMLTANQKVTVEEVKKEADKRLAKDEPKPKGKR
jgi:hypothetical protein